MATIMHDPLLGATRLLLRLFGRLCLVLAALLLIVGPLALTGGAWHSPAHPGSMSLAQYQSVGLSMLVLLAPTLALYGWFVLILQRIVDTVAAGDPFTRQNADRLARMAWLSLALKLVMLAGAAILQAAGQEMPLLHLHAPGGLLMALVLFVLARVFRQGAAMREDLEGTV